MSWTPPLTWTDGLLVAASTLNAQLRDNLRYLKGQLGEIFFENALDIAETSQPSNPPAGRVRVWNTNVPNRQMLYSRFNDGTQRRLAHYAIRLKRASNFSVPAASITNIPIDVVDFSSHPLLSMSDGIGFVAPEAGLYLATANVRFSTATSGEVWISLRVNATQWAIAGGIYGLATSAVSTIVSLNAGDTVRIDAYSILANTAVVAFNTPSLSVVSL